MTGQKPLRKVSFLVAGLLVFGAGFVFGAASIHRSVPPAPKELPPPRHPWVPKDISGLIGSAGIRLFSGHLDVLPLVALETDRTLVLSISSSKTKVHYVLVPKKDILDAGQIDEADLPYLLDIFTTAGRLIEENKLKDYQIYTNGPGKQTVRYLHFHLVGKITAR